MFYIKKIANIFETTLFFQTTTTTTTTSTTSSTTSKIVAYYSINKIWFYSESNICVNFIY